MRLILLALALVIWPAQADEIVIHLGSYHSKPGFNNTNPGLGYRTEDGWGAGLYQNSYNKSTAYISKELMYNKNLGLVLGLGTGYKIQFGHSISPIGGVMFKRELTSTSKLNILALPPIGRGTAAFVHAAISVKI